MKWTADDLREWRSRLRWTQLRAAEALAYHVEAYKKLEAGTRSVAPRVARLCLLTEREHVRSMYSASGEAGARQVFASLDRVLSRLETLKHNRSVRRGMRAPVCYVSLFAGIEGATAAFERLQADAVPVEVAETDAAANAVLRRRWPDVPRVGDVTEFDWVGLRGQVELVVGGPPCQSFSIAGRRLGIHDPRGNLALHFLRAVGAMQPRWVLFENVPGLLSANDGGDFDTFLAELEKLGYACAWRVLDARHFGLPQRRRRLWLVAERAGDGSGPGHILGLGTGEAGSSGACRPAWKKCPGRAAEGVGDMTPDVDWSEAAAWLRSPGAAKATTDNRPTDVPTDRMTEVFAADLRHCTLSGHTMTLQVGPIGGWSLNALPCALEVGAETSTIRRFTPLECLRLQGFDDDWLDGVRVAGRPLTDSEKYRLAGNAWSVAVAAWILERMLARMASQPRVAR